MVDPASDSAPPATTPPTAAPRGPTRRRFLGLVLALGGGVVLVRGCGYRAPERWRGEFLSRREAATLAAAAEALLPDVAGDALPSGPSAWEVARNVDQYVLAMPQQLRRDIRALLVAIEHLTPLGGRLPRFTRLDAAGRAVVLESFAGHDTMRLLYRGIRDLVMLGWYQDQRTWSLLQYEGPLVGPCLPGRWSAPERVSRYASLMAPAGELPRSAR